MGGRPGLSLGLALGSPIFPSGCEGKLGVALESLQGHSSVLAWRIPGTGEPGGLPSTGLRPPKVPRHAGFPRGVSSCSGGHRPLVELCVEPAGLCGRCTGVAVPLRVVPSATGLPSKRGPGHEKS